MEITPTTGSKRSRPQVVVNAPAVKTERKTLTTTRKKSVAVTSDLTEPVPADLEGMIQTAAFYLAAERRFEPGHELDDWLEAERQIKARYRNT